MTRESKLALIVGFVLILVVGVLVSDHLSQASNDTIDPNTGIERAQPIAELPSGQHERAVIENSIRQESPLEFAPRNPLIDDEPIVITQAPREDSLFDRMRESVNSLSENGAPTLIAQSRPEPARTYTVQSNDSLYAIARSMLGDGERWREIHTLNARLLGPDPVLQPGMVLTLPSDAKGTEPAPVRRETAKPSSRSGVAPTTYEVQPGDVLSMISQRLLGTSKRAREIADLNGLKDLDDIRIGMVLKIPAR
ncbi:MAG: LysM peptidoglycan-binding domain-containing protein [Phycisphaerales bacterium]|nr:LysM peptidoglycan-binding domain-containing protein [Phycisphaerales bacterium]